MTESLPAAPAVTRESPLWSLCPSSLVTPRFGRLPAYHLFATPRTALCGQPHAGLAFLTAEECSRPGLPLHCSACETARQSGS